MTDRMMLINGRHAEELRVAIVENRVLQLYDVEGAEASQKRGNIYRGVVSNIEPSLNAAFVDFGDAKKGFLTRHDVTPQAFHHKVDDPRRAPIDKVLKKGQAVTVQVTRDAEAQKGATLTTNLSVAGRYLVFLPFDEQRGVSRKVEDETMRRKLRDKAKGLDVGAGEGFIIRTNGAEQTKTDLRADLQGLTRLWKMVIDEAQRGRGPKLLYNDQNLLIHALRDYLDTSIDEVWIDDAALHAEAERYLQATMPRTKVALKRYEERTPLFSRFNLEPQIAGIYRRVVPLASGGSIVIDHTEALTAVDVNSGKARQGSTQGETAYQTNLEAAAEVARQLRLRDIGGLVVVDFIDMRASKHQRAVEKALRDTMKLDRARHSTSRISANGLVEINRQRIRRALQLRTHRECPTCEGVGRLISPELLSLSLVRRVEARAATGRLVKARVALHPELADFTQNRRRGELAELERAYGIRVEIVGDRRVEPSGERIDWQNREEAKWPAEADADRRAIKAPEPVKSEGREKSKDKAVSSSTLIDAPSPSPSRDEDEEERQSRRSRRGRRRRRRGRGEGERSQQESKDREQQEAPSESAESKPAGAETRAKETSPDVVDEGSASGRDSRESEGREGEGREREGRDSEGRDSEGREGEGREREGRGRGRGGRGRGGRGRSGRGQGEREQGERAGRAEEKSPASVAPSEAGNRSDGDDDEARRSSRRRRRRRRRRPEGGEVRAVDRDQPNVGTDRPASRPEPSAAPVGGAPRGDQGLARGGPVDRAAPTTSPQQPKAAPIVAAAPAPAASADSSRSTAAPSKKATEQKAPSKKVTEQKAPSKKVTEKKVTEKKVTEQKAPSKKVTEKKAAAKKTATKKTATKKTATKKTATKKAATKKTASKKVAAKKTATKKTPSKKAPGKKTATKKTASKKAAAKKTATKKTASKKTATKKTAGD